MIITTVTSRELNQDVGRPRKAAKSGPVFITDRGKPAHVLLSTEDYRRLAGQGRSLVGALSMPALANIDFDPPCVRIEAPPPDLRDAQARRRQGRNVADFETTREEVVDPWAGAWRRLSTGRIVSRVTRRALL